MAGLVPAIRTSTSAATDGRDKPGHDVEDGSTGPSHRDLVQRQREAASELEVDEDIGQPAADQQQQIRKRDTGRHRDPGLGCSFVRAASWLVGPSNATAVPPISAATNSRSSDTRPRAVPPDHRDQNVPRGGEISRTEQHPAAHDEQQCHRPAERRAACAVPRPARHGSPPAPDRAARPRRRRSSWRHAKARPAASWR